MDILHPRELKELSQEQMFDIALCTMTAWAPHQGLALKVLKAY